MAAPKGPITTPLTELFGIRHPIILAGMARVSGGALAAAVTNAGGMGVIGGFMYTPQQLRDHIAEMKAALRDPENAAFGIDLALPQVGGGARKTNHDYTGGRLDELIDITIESGARLFVSAVGVPPPHVVDRLHAAGILVMNMVGHPKHARKALDAGVDLVCAQGGEGGGHTGDIASSVLIPAVADIARRYRPALLARKLGRPDQTALLVAAGGISRGRSLAAALMQGATGVWVGTRFVACAEAGCSEEHKRAVVGCAHEATERTLVLTGRPCRVLTNEYVARWHGQPERVRELCDKGVVPIEHDWDNGVEDADMPHVMGQVAGAIDRIQTAAEIVQEMVDEAAETLRQGAGYLSGSSAGGRGSAGPEGARSRL